MIVIDDDEVKRTSERLATETMRIGEMRKFGISW